MRKKTCIFSLITFVLVGAFLSISVEASILGTAGEFNAFIFDDYACTSDAEGRVAVGGNMTVSGYSVADKLTPEEVSTYNKDMLIVGGNLTYSSGRVYYGNIRVGGTVDMPSYVPDGKLIKNKPIPIDFAAEEASLRSLSTQLSQLTPNGTVEAKWGALSLKGDGTNALQIFKLDGQQMLNAHTFDVQNIAAGATILFNISGATAGLTNMSMESLAPFQTTTLFNFYEAATLQLGGIAVRGSILAPFATVNNPQGVIWGTIIAASWNGPMQQNHVPFTGQITIEQEPDGDNPADDETSDEVIISLEDNKNSQYKITFVERNGNTWTYNVEEINGRSLSHWDLGISSCLDHITGYTPQSGFEQGTDGSTEFTGIKWDLADNFTNGNFSFTLDGDYPEGIVEVLAKAGTKSAIGTIIGPNCDVVPQPPTPSWESDLSVTKTAPAHAEIGETITYTITVTNNGPQNSEVYDGRGVTLTDALPEGVTLVSVTPSQGTCDETIACDLGALNYLQSATVEVQVRVDQAGTITNTVTVSPERPGDSNLGNNTAFVDTTVTAPQPQEPQQIDDVLLIGINDEQDRFEIYNTATKETSFPKAFEIVITESGERQRVEAQKVPDEIDNLVYVSEGTYYGIQSLHNSENPDGISQLYKFTLNHDTTEITIEKVGQPFSGTDIDSIEYGDNLFYAIDDNTDTLLVLDMKGHIISSKNISDLGLTNVEDLAYKDGTLYASNTDDTDSSLFSISVLNGLDHLLDSDIQYIGQIGYGQVEALTFIDDILYGTSDNNDSLFSIDLGTGFATFMDDWGTDIEGIAGVYPGSMAAVPEPGTWLLVGLGMLGITYIRRKRQK